MFGKNQTYDCQFCLQQILMKLFKTTDMNTVKECQDYFPVSLPSSVIAKRAEKISRQVNLTLNTHRTFLSSNLNVLMCRCEKHAVSIYIYMLFCV